MAASGFWRQTVCYLSARFFFVTTGTTFLWLVTEKWRWQSYAMSLECHILYSLNNIVKLCESVWIFEYYSFHLTSLRLIFLWLSLCLHNNYHIAIMRNNTYFKVSCLRYDFMRKLEVIREKNSMSSFHVLCPFTVSTLTGHEWV